MIVETPLSRLSRQCGGFEKSTKRKETKRKREKGGYMRLTKGTLAMAILAGAVLAILNVPAPALAQSSAMVVTIPFDFHVGKTALPAGTYTVHLQSEAIQISDSNGHSAFVISQAVPNPAAKLDNQIVFNRYGDERYLSEVRWLGYPAGRGLIKSDKEIELAKVFTERNVLSASLTK
jgi:hypothetical protein